MPGEQQDMVWSVMTHEHRQHSTDWYWALGVITLAGILLSIFFGNILLAAILLLGAGSIGFLAARGPREHLIKIGDRGISVDGTHYPFAGIHSFWVEHEVEQPRLFLSMKSLLSPHFSLVLDDEAQGDAVRAHLKQHVTEEEQGPHIGEHLAEIFGL